MDVRYTPEMFMSYFAGLKGLAMEELDVAPVVVLSWGPKIAKSLANVIGAKLSPGWIGEGRYDLYTGEVGGQRVSILHATVGAPCTVMQMEQLIACGARVFIGVGYAGSLQPSAPIGTFLIPTGCVSEEGTSAHYIDNNAPINPSQPLVARLKESCHAAGIEVKLGSLWTTDAPFRELTSKIDEYRSQGVLGVDMETSAMYALGQYRGVRVCNLLMVSDELWHEWRIAFHKPELNQAEQIAEQVILRCLEDMKSISD
ncbi:nucleoside phosphorylase [Chloroflexota bacterium]